MGEDEKTISSKPLFDRLDARKGAATELAGRLQISHGRLANWRTRGIPAAMLPEVAAYLGMTTDAYLELTGRKRVLAIAQPRGQYTFEGQRFMEDFYALPSGLQEHIAKKTAELRAYADTMPDFLKDALKPPADPDAYRAWEKAIEANMAKRRAALQPANSGPKKRRP